MVKTILILSPHADDAELGCGGYIARTIYEGGTVIVALATVGAIKFIHLDREVTASEREEEFNKSMAVLGVQHTHILTRGLDSNLNTFPQGDMVGMLDSLQKQYTPDEVLIPLPSAHQDHRYCWEVGVATTRPSAARHTPTMIAAYEYPLSSWGDGAAANSFTGGVYVNIEDYWEHKIEALSQYGTQMRGQYDLISTGGVEALARLRGIEAGFKYAELLHALRIRHK